MPTPNAYPECLPLMPTPTPNSNQVDVDERAYPKCLPLMPTPHAYPYPYP